MPLEPLRLADAPDVLTAVEVARVLRCDRDTVYDLIHTHQIKTKRYGRRIIIPKRSVEAYLTIVATEEAS